jgi:hypothetical protein
MSTQIALCEPLACDEESSMTLGHRRRLDGGRQSRVNGIRKLVLALIS